MFKQHTACRACGCENLEQVFDLGIQPLANDFRKPGNWHSGYAPLKVLLCSRCKLAQLSVVVDPRVLYSRYPYVTSPSVTMLNYFDVLATELSKRQQLGNVLEIGSNDGALLAHLRDRFSPGVHDVLGVDPAENLGCSAAARGIRTIPGFWDEDVAQRANALMPIDTIIARHVFAHVDDWTGFLAAIQAAGHENTMTAIEVPYALDLLMMNAFDTIYHEHLSYLSVTSMIAALSRTRLEIRDVLRFPLHGGVLVFVIGRAIGSEKQPLPEAVRLLVQNESDSLTADSWGAMQARSRYLIEDLRWAVRNMNPGGKRVCVYGASAKSSVWLNACGFTPDDICFITDTTSWKHGTLAPGTGIPVVPESRLYDGVDYAILCAWNYKDEVLAKHKAFLDSGGRFIVPCPEFEIV